MRIATIIIASLLVSGCLSDDPLNKAFETFEPREIGDGLTLSNPTSEHIDSTMLASIYNDIYTDDNLWSMRSMLVFRNGHLVSESYLKDERDITTQHLIWSCTKQVVGVLVGIAVDKGLITSIDDPISKYMETELNGHEDKNDITIHNLLTMRSGIDYENSGVGGETDKLLRQIPENSVDFVLSRPVNAQQGKTFHYNDGNPHLLSALLQNVTGKPTDVWADEVLFSHIGMDNYNWVRYKDGVTFGGFGIETTPRELSKVALCVANDGTWESKQIVSPEWIQDMINPWIDLPDSYFKFGYYWWLDPTRGIHFMWGHGGQFAFIVPEENVVVVMTSIPNTQGDYEIHAEEALPIVDRIIAACF